VGTYAFEFLPEVQVDVNALDEDLRRAIADIVVGFHDNPWQGELMDDRWPHNLEGCRKIRFDKPGWKGRPRCRFVCRNEPSDGAVARMLVLGIGRRDNMIAYAQASGRLTKREAAKRMPGSRTP
jgi:hypothetical protein